MESKERKVYFYSDGLKLAGILHLPPDLAPGDKRPGIIYPIGYTGVKEGGFSYIIKLMAKAGYVGLIFDYRGLGESEGQRGRLIPMDQVEDINNAVTFLTQQPEVDANRIAIFGASFGGANAVYAGAVNPRVKAVVSLNGVGSYRRRMRDGMRYYEWRQFLKRIEAHKVQRVLTGKADYVYPYEIMPADPSTISYMNKRYETVPGMRVQVSFELAEKLLEYSPDSVVHLISPRASLFMHGDEDDMVPIDESLIMYEEAGEPKRFVVVPGATHFTVYEEPAASRIVQEITQWFSRYL